MPLNPPQSIDSIYWDNIKQSVSDNSKTEAKTEQKKGTGLVHRLKYRPRASSGRGEDTSDHLILRLKVWFSFQKLLTPKVIAVLGPCVSQRKESLGESKRCRISARTLRPGSETLLKKRKQRGEKATAARTARKLRALSVKRKLLFRRVGSYVKEYRIKDIIQMERAARPAIFPLNPKFFSLFVSGGIINEISPKPRKILQILRLLQINNGVFVKATKPTLQMLRLVEPYATYNIQTGMSKTASNFLWPFKLFNPTGEWRTRKFKHYIEGGDQGNREDNINKLIRQMFSCTDS
ncbi:hypothetical protein Clacol_008570 [Clathrus columnatus]|uniref:Large ribosomal subunit protein uL30-like ferredoxin-like fold domain-containing protein n=1 Tax=Clathrus columnatus TaxID=1419009 RepID=A0AAV5AN45_9AGAM|nr:hypothetical protein Clacol_008570 [Clathrus columnatus]